MYLRILSKQAEKLIDKKILVFDLDGTLTASKHNLDKEMAGILRDVLDKKIIAVIGGGDYSQFQQQFIKCFKISKEQSKNLYILPTSGSRMYKYIGGDLKMVYKIDLTEDEKKQILAAFDKSFIDINYVNEIEIFGDLIEDRDSQITFSAHGQKASLDKKVEWNKDKDIRLDLKKALDGYLPEFEIRLGGLTSVDVTKKGIDKAYGVEQLEKELSISIKDMAFIGDALYEGGNDHAVLRTNIYTVQVDDFEETKYLLRQLLK